MPLKKKEGENVLNPAVMNKAQNKKQQNGVFNVFTKQRRLQQGEDLIYNWLNLNYN